MIVTSDRLLAAIRHSHTVRFETMVLPAAGGAPVPFEIAGGDVTGDRTALIRRTCRVALNAGTVAELAAGHAIPDGGYVHLARGVRYGDGTGDLVDLGLFRIDSVNASRPEGTASLVGSDRMSQVIDEKLLAPYAASGKKPTSAIVELVTDVFPDVSVTIGTNVAAETVLADVVYDTDRGRAVAELAQTIGAEAFFDVGGNFHVVPAPDPASQPSVWTINVGDDGVLVAHADALERQQAENGVLVIGQPDATSPPVQVLVFDDDPASGTYWGGLRGKVPFVIETPAVQSEEQALEVATRELASRLGLARTLTLRVVPNPALEPDDVVDVVFEDGTVEAHVIDQITMPLNAVDACQITTRSVWQPLPAALGVVAGSDAWRALKGSRR